MAGWQDNTIMTWDGSKVTDHGRSPVSVNVERIGTDRRMADGTLRRQYVGTKRTWQVSWENLPSNNDVVGGYQTVDGGWSGSDMENFYNNTHGAFIMILRAGSAIDTAVPAYDEDALPYDDGDFCVVRVMFTDFSKEIRKRGAVDFWSMSVALEEV